MAYLIFLYISIGEEYINEHYVEQIIENGSPNKIWADESNA